MVDSHCFCQLHYFNPESFKLQYRAVDPHSFYADPDPDPAVFLNEDPDPDPGPGPGPGPGPVPA